MAGHRRAGFVVREQRPSQKATKKPLHFFPVYKAQSVRPPFARSSSSLPAGRQRRVVPVLPGQSDSPSALPANPFVPEKPSHRKAAVLPGPPCGRSDKRKRREEKILVWSDPPDGNSLWQVGCFLNTILLVPRLRLAFRPHRAAKLPHRKKACQSESDRLKGDGW